MYKINSILVLILLVSFSVFCQDRTLNAIDITEGEYAGYQMLKGYENEDLYRVYFKDHSKDNLTSYQVTCESLKKVDMDEIISWEYKNRIIISTRRDLYKFFSDASYFTSRKDVMDKGELSIDWFFDTFGEVYQDWFDNGVYLDEAERLVERYFRQDEPLNDRFITIEY